LEGSPHGVRVAMDPESKVRRPRDTGTRTLAMAQGAGHQVAQRLAPDGVPVFLPDGFKASMSAVLTP
jgi:hypothetical protein